MTVQPAKVAPAPALDVYPLAVLAFHPPEVPADGHVPLLTE